MCKRRPHARLAWESAAKAAGAERPEPQTGRVLRQEKDRRPIGGKRKQQRKRPLAVPPGRAENGTNRERAGSRPRRRGAGAPDAPLQTDASYERINLVYTFIIVQDRHTAAGGKRNIMRTDKPLLLRLGFQLLSLILTLTLPLVVLI